MSADWSPSWLFTQDLKHFALLADIDAVAGVDCSRAADNPASTRCNQAFVGPDATLSADQVQAVGDWFSDADLRPVFAIYGDPGGRVDALEAAGYREHAEAALDLRVWRRQTGTRPMEFTAGSDRPTPPVVDIPAAAWPAAVRDVRGEDTPELAIAQCESKFPAAHFAGIRIGDRFTSVVARYDWDGQSQVQSLYTDPDFRKTGFAFACANHVLARTPFDCAFVLARSGDRAVGGICTRLNAGIAAERIVRRWTRA